MDKHPIRAIFNGVQQAAEPQYSTLSRRTIEGKGHTIVQVDSEGVRI